MCGNYVSGLTAHSLLMQNIIKIYVSKHQTKERFRESTICYGYGRLFTFSMSTNFTKAINSMVDAICNLRPCACVRWLNLTNSSAELYIWNCRRMISEQIYRRCASYVRSSSTWLNEKMICLQMNQSRLLLNHPSTCHSLEDSQCSISSAFLIIFFPFMFVGSTNFLITLSI